ncbi:hypothetical protein BDR03DRAFT_1017057 [Suillus americanus]|nr:hypothetical protein BDR03DRAFT_1017057 [Suillus americanus]
MHANFTLEDQSDPGQADDTGCLIDPDLYLRPEDDVIDVDEFPDAADPPTFDPATSEVSISSNKSFTELPADQLELDFEEVHLMARELHPFGKYQHPEYQSIRDRLRDYTRRAGGLPDPSLQQLLEAKRPFQTAWAETSDRLKKLMQTCCQDRCSRGTGSEGLGLSSCAVPLTRVRALNFRMKSGVKTGTQGGRDLKGLASARALCPLPEYVPLISE